MNENTFAFGQQNSFFALRCYMTVDGKNVETNIPLSRVDYLMACGDTLSQIVLVNGNRIMVDLPLDRLRDKLDAAADGVVADLCAETKELHDAALLSDVFNSAVSGSGEQNKFHVILHGKIGDCPEPALIILWSFEISHMRPSSPNQTLVWHFAHPNFTVNLPHDLMEQFYTHAVERNAGQLDLTALTDPKGSFQKNSSLLAKIKPLYPVVKAPRQ